MTSIGPRGRITIPVAVQKAAGIAEGDEVIIRCTAPGVVTVETPDAIREAFRTAIPPNVDHSVYDAVADVRALRDGTL
jgi:bifunctional DNA-binding transcriptional regulator/antitoxin component of YhaV-PrlF toxin-antitoxin module